MSDEFSGARPVQHPLDLPRLHEYLATHVAAYPAQATLDVQQFRGGQSNPTYRLEVGGQRYVLRRKPPGALLASAHAVDREHRIITALQGSGVPVPRTYCLCTDETVIGTPFYVMELVEGRIFWDPLLPGLHPAERRQIYGEMGRVLAALHTLDPAAHGLSDYGKAGNYFQRQIDRWSRQYQAGPAERIPAMDRLVAWLPGHVPPGDETTLVHGDYRLDNLIFHPHEPRLLAVLDWELSTLGHPLGDLAYHCMTWHIPAGVFRGLAGADLAELGIPSEAEHLAGYLGRTGRGPIPPDDWDFYLAYNLFRIAAILHGILGRVKEGTAASERAAMMGQAAWPLAELGWQQVEKIAASRG
jgi:aminoglycoside phosphotransferase (APT) family kinase protein